MWPRDSWRSSTLSQCSTLMIQDLTRALYEIETKKKGKKKKPKHRHTQTYPQALKG